MSRVRIPITAVLSLPLVLFAATVAHAQYPPQVTATFSGGYESNGLPIGVPETTSGVYGEPLQRYDAPYPWLHGYVQEIPAYEGYGAFRPYNYKHVFSQSQAAGGWGMPANMPYAQQFWHRYRERARMAPQHAYSR